jgi:hypothetical protein
VLKAKICFTWYLKSNWRSPGRLQTPQGERVTGACSSEAQPGCILRDKRF